MTSLFAKKVYTGSKIIDNQLITAHQGKITDIKTGAANDAMQTVECLSAAFIDLQVNGGSDLNFTEKGDEAAVQDINNSCANLGTGFILPTIITSPLENILKGIEAVKSYQQKFPNSGILGMHLEGPFINPEKRGAHALKWVRKPTNTELNEIIHYGGGIVYFGETDHPIPWQTDHLNCWRTDAANAVEACTKIVI